MNYLPTVYIYVTFVCYIWKQLKPKPNPETDKLITAQHILL